MLSSPGSPGTGSPIRNRWGIFRVPSKGLPEVPCGSLRPDLVIVNRQSRRLMLFKLTCPCDSNIENAYSIHDWNFFFMDVWFFLFTRSYITYFIRDVTRFISYFKLQCFKLLIHFKSLHFERLGLLFPFGWKRFLHWFSSYSQLRCSWIGRHQGIHPPM